VDFTTIISIADAAKAIAAGQCRVFDCSFDLTNPDKGRAIHATSHLPGAHYLHLDEDLAGAPSGTNGRHPLPDPLAFTTLLRSKGLNSGEQVIAYDNVGGPFAARLWWLLRWLGHENVAVMDGAAAAWQAAGYAVEQGMTAQERPGNFEIGAIREDLTVDAALVLSAIGTGKSLLLDTRSGPRFRGEVLVMDAVAGHIPGARNRPFTDNLGTDGRFKSPELLRQELEEIIEGYAPADVILQCGSGVTACHNALSMHHAGMTGSRLYPGSWSEWVSDPARPVEVGVDVCASPE
tara:strand:+ start:1059 stop:1934 length:876 start_codon:yes stop_codon:yes gene_type:complete